MIEQMISEINKFLPFTIDEIAWDGTILNMHGSKWAFNTLSAWRIITEKKMVYGCYDKNSQKMVDLLKGLEIIDIRIQNSILKIDPVFILSNKEKIEIFSTDIYEPWTLYVDELYCYVPTPNDPDFFK